VSYNWNFGDATNTNSIVESPIYLYLNAGRYPVTLQTESNEGCISVYTDTAVVLEKPVADFDFENVCFGESMPFKNNSFFSSGTPFYDWQFDDGGTSAQRDPEYSYSEPGDYNVLLTVTSPDQCFDTMRQTVEVYELPQPRVEAQETTVSKGFSTQLAATGGVSYLWSPGESLNEADIQTPVATPLETTTYAVTALDSNGCVNDTAITIDVEEDYKAIANNVITPDGNGQNDRWIVQNLDNYTDCTVSIYNRWGQKVYSEKGYNNTWRGTNQAGEPLPDATYYYVIWFEGSDREYKGAVTVLRNER
jgi:gliding motility-associated-like protein